jgi:hypothetical protein
MAVNDNPDDGGPVKVDEVRGIAGEIRELWNDSDVLINADRPNIGNLYFVHIELGKRIDQLEKALGIGGATDDHA